MNVPVVGGYEQLQLIGSGGFSQVYRARQSNLHRDVAIKVLNIGLASDAERREFQREAESLGRVSTHPNIVSVYDTAFTSGGNPCIVMELYSGGSLADLIAATGPLSERAVLAVGVAIASALDASHQAGVVHCDIKPQNVLISQFGQPVLGDFGISVLTEERSRNNESLALSLSCAAPEIVEGERPTIASDLYSLGAALYTALAGQSPFSNPPGTEQPPPAAWMRRILSEDPAPLASFGVSAEIETLISWAMNKDRSLRPPSAASFANELYELGQRLGYGTAVPRTSDRQELPVLGAVPVNLHDPSFTQRHSELVRGDAPAPAEPAAPAVSADARMSTMPHAASGVSNADSHETQSNVAISSTLPGQSSGTHGPAADAEESNPRRALVLVVGVVLATLAALAVYAFGRLGDETTATTAEPTVRPTIEAVEPTAAPARPTQVPSTPSVTPTAPPTPTVPTVTPAAVPTVTPAAAPGVVDDGSLGTVIVAPGEAIQIRSFHAVVGPLDFLGRPGHRLTEYAVADYGDVQGFEVELDEPLNDGCSGDDVESLVNEVVLDTRIVGIIGTSCSGTAAAAAPIFGEAGITMISPSATSPDLTGPDRAPGYFRVAHNDTSQAVAMARYLIDDLGLVRVAAVHNSDAFTSSLAQAFTDEVEALGGVVGPVVAISPGTGGVPAALEEIAAFEPDALFMPVFDDIVRLIVEQAPQLDGLSESVLTSTDTISFSPLLELPESAGLLFTTPDLRNEGNRNERTGRDWAQLAVRYDADYNERPAFDYWEHSYDATVLLLDAINAASTVRADGSLMIDRVGIQTYLEQVDGFAGLSGILSCDRSGDCSAQRILILEHNDPTALEETRTNIVYTFESDSE